ncbi:MAG: hypothetical protein R3D58_16860 [Saprospiraceae bacterium]|nr:hypothetical protein [Lewinellaceae bacterium]
MKQFLLGLFLVLFVISCKNEEEPLPAYLTIEPFTVDALGGAGWQKITDGWLYVNDEFLGGYSLPATVPILADGDVTIELFPGVKENGIVQTPGLYPFLESYKTPVTLSPGQTTNLQPGTKYSANAIFPWSVDRGSFNVTNIVLENRDADTATSFIITPDGAFDGRSVYLRVDTAHAVIEIATEEVENLPSTGGRQVWLEMHYRNDILFELWLLGNNGGGSNELAQPVFQFLPSENWNKIYFNLTDFLVSLQQVNYRLFFRVTLQAGTTGTPEQTSGNVYLDNIRLVHF